MHYFTPGDVFKDERTEGPIRSTERPRDACKRRGRRREKRKGEEGGKERDDGLTHPLGAKMPRIFALTWFRAVRRPLNKKRTKTSNHTLRRDITITKRTRIRIRSDQARR